MTPLRRPAGRLSCALTLIALCAGCATTLPPRGQSQTERFLKHPEFRAAARHAPQFTADVLHALADLETRPRK
jgi:hypothetical protein